MAVRPNYGHLDTLFPPVKAEVGARIGLTCYPTYGRSVWSPGPVEGIYEVGGLFASVGTIILQFHREQPLTTESQATVIDFAEFHARQPSSRVSQSLQNDGDPKLMAERPLAHLIGRRHTRSYNPVLAVQPRHLPAQRGFQAG